MQLAIALDVALKLLTQRRLFFALGGERAALHAQLVGRTHQILRQVIGHAARFGACVIGPKALGARLQAPEAPAQALHVLLGGRALAAQLLEARVPQRLDVLDRGVRRYQEGVVLLLLHDRSALARRRRLLLG